MSRSKYRPSFSSSLWEHSSTVVISIPAAASPGRRSRFQSFAWRAASSLTRFRMAASAAPGASPSTERIGISDSSSSSRPATRIMKNSSMNWAKIAANFTRSRSGSVSSSASSSTRA